MHPARACVENRTGHLDILKLGSKRRDLDVRLLDETLNNVNKNQSRDLSRGRGMLTGRPQQPPVDLSTLPRWVPNTVDVQTPTCLP